MRLLQICPKPPRPIVDGGCIAMDAMTFGLRSQGHYVKVLAMATEKHPHIEGVNFGDYQSVKISTALNPIDALLNLLSNKSYNVSRFNHDSVANAITETLDTEEFDAVILESIYACSYVDLIRKHSTAQIILRAHNIEHKIWHDLTRKYINPIKSWYFKRLARQLESFEISVALLVDGVVAITEDDSRWFEKVGASRVHVLPFSMEFLEPKPQKTFDHVFHLGSMDWLPNIEGVKWMLGEVWPLVRAELSEARIVIAGRNMPPQFRSDQKMGVEVLGEVQSASDFLNRPGIATVPVLSGSGMRIKAIEAMASGLPIVGTELGLCSLGLEHDKNAMIANTSKEFARSILDLLSDPNKASRIAQNGYMHASKNFDTKLVFSDLIAFIKNFG